MAHAIKSLIYLNRNKSQKNLVLLKTDLISPIKL